MIGPFRNRTIAIATVALLQLAFLGYFVWDREMRVRHGQDVVLEVVPVDPRSLFQGDYVILGYPISTLEAWYGAEPTVGATVFVSVAPGPDGTWHLHDYQFGDPSGLRPGGVALKGQVDRILHAAPTDGSGKGQFRVVYGLERYFVPEGKGRDLEALVRDKKLSAIVSVWRDGSSALKGLQSQGKVLFETGVAAKTPEQVPPPQPGEFAAPAPPPEAPAATDASPATPSQASEPPPPAAP